MKYERVLTYQALPQTPAWPHLCQVITEMLPFSGGTSMSALNWKPPAHPSPSSTAPCPGFSQHIPPSNLSLDVQTFESLSSETEKEPTARYNTLSNLTDS